MSRHHIVVVLVLLVACWSFTGVVASEEENEERQRIDDVEWQGLQALISEIEAALPLYDRAFGYVFLDNIDLSLFNSGHGVGLAVEIETNSRTYLELPPGGLNVGPGERLFQVIFLIEDEDTFRDFLEDGTRASPQSALDSDTDSDTADDFEDGVAFFFRSEGTGTLRETRTLDAVTLHGLPGNDPIEVLPERQATNTRTVNTRIWRRAAVPTCRPRLDDDLNDR